MISIEKLLNIKETTLHLCCILNPSVNFWKKDLIVHIILISLDGKCQSDMLPGVYRAYSAVMEINATDNGTLVGNYNDDVHIVFQVTFDKDCLGMMVPDSGSTVNFEYDPETCKLSWTGTSGITFDKDNCNA